MCSMLLLTLTVLYLCFLYLHRHDDEHCLPFTVYRQGGQGGSSSGGGGGSGDKSPSLKYDETGSRGSAANFFLSDQIDRQGAAM